MFFNQIQMSLWSDGFGIKSKYSMCQGIVVFLMAQIYEWTTNPMFVILN